MKKGIVIQALLRLILVMNKRPFTFDKYLAHEVFKTKHWKKISTFIHQIEKINSFEDYIKVRIIIRNYINSTMPKNPILIIGGNFSKSLKDSK